MVDAKAPKGRVASRAVEDRFWSKANKNGPTVYEDIGPCWIWTAGRSDSGYGSFSFRGKTANAHRVAWLLKYGPIPEGAQILHYCDTRCCVRPSHLFLGNHLENMQDMKRKGRARAGRRKLSPTDAALIRSCQDMSASVVADRWGVSLRHVYDIWNGTAWAAMKPANENGGR